MAVLQQSRDLRVLIVEDDTDVRGLLGSHLRRLHCVVRSVGTGEECLSAAADEVPDVVVVDIVLPGIDGRQVVGALRADPATAGCVLVVCSVLEPADLADLCADALLPKPFVRRDVRLLVEALRDRGGFA